MIPMILNQMNSDSDKMQYYRGEWYVWDQPSHSNEWIFLECKTYCACCIPTIHNISLTRNGFLVFLSHFESEWKGNVWFCINFIESEFHQMEKQRQTFEFQFHLLSTPNAASYSITIPQWRVFCIICLMCMRVCSVHMITFVDRLNEANALHLRFTKTYESIRTDW